jgi:hypothetical protein
MVDEKGNKFKSNFKMILLSKSFLFISLWHFSFPYQLDITNKYYNLSDIVDLFITQTLTLYQCDG